MRKGIIAAAALLAGCTSSTWYHPHYASHASADRQFRIDSGHCTAMARGGGPAYIPVPESGSTTTFSGTAYGPGGQTYVDGYARTEPQGNAISGFANGYNIGNAVGAASASSSVYEGCMLSRGWTDDPNEARANRPRQSTDAAFENPRPGSLADYMKNQ